MNKELTQDLSELYQVLAKIYEQICRSEDQRLKFSLNQLKFRCNPEAITQKDLGDFLSELKNDLEDGPRNEQLPRLMLKKCEALVKTDNDAELVRSGFMLGEALSVYHRERFYGLVQVSHRAKGRKTQADKLKKRNADMVADYSELVSEVSCLSARQRLRDKYNLTLTRVNSILKDAGIVINQKS